ncbi:protein tyrosine phosphatase type IVA protein 1, partial [Globomyces pollinis-pini]
LRFLLMDCPNDENCESFVNELKAHNVTTVVRVCEATYDKNQFVNNGIEFIDLPYPDGTVPTNQEIVKFIQLCQKTFGSISIPNHIIQDEIITPIQNPKVIAVHCMVGLGRAPLLVAIALIEAGFAPLDAIEYIRQAKRGAMNPSQLKYLLDYKK